MWPFQRKKQKEILNPWQKWLKDWQEESGLGILLEPMREQQPSSKGAMDAYWLIYQEEILAVITGDKLLAERLLRAIPINNSNYDRSLLALLEAPVIHLEEILLDYQRYTILIERTMLSCWIKPHLYMPTLEPLVYYNPLFRYAIFYHLMVVRFKEQEKSLSWHISQIKEVGLWQPKSDWAMMQVIIQSKNPAMTLDFWLSWPQKGDTQGSWKSIVQRFCYYTRQSWQEARVEIIYRDSPEATSLRDYLGVQGEIRFKEPYRLPLVLLLAKDQLQNLARNFYSCQGGHFWSLYHQIQSRLWVKNHQTLESMAFCGTLQSKGQLPSVADFLLFLPESEQDKILQNFIGMFYADKARAIFCYQASLDSSDIRWVTSDLFEHNLLAKLPRNLANDWAYLSVSGDLEEWKILNEEVLNALGKRIRDGQISLSPLAKSWLVRWVLNPYQQRYAQQFREKYQYFETQWNLMPQSHKHQLMAKIHNGQWIYILRLRPEFLATLQKYVSRRRYSMMQEEVCYIQEQLEQPYWEAVRVLKQIADVKY